MREFFKSKAFFGGVGIFAVLMAMTNPGQLELYNEMRQFLINIRGSSGESYTNLVVLSFGTSDGYEQNFIRKEDGSYGYISKSTKVSYVGMFNNYFALVELDRSGKESFEIIPK